MSNGSRVKPAALSDHRGQSNGTSANIPRSASYAELPPDHAATQTLPESTEGMRRSLSENVLSTTQGTNEWRPYAIEGSGQNLNNRRSIRRADWSTRRSAHSLPKSRASTIDFTLGGDDLVDDAVPQPKAVVEVSSPNRVQLRRSVSGSIHRFARRSWMPASRSPSPAQHKRRTQQEKATASGMRTETPRVQSSSNSDNQHERIHSANDGHGGGIKRRDSLLARKSRRPLSALLGKEAALDVPSVPPIPKSFSTDKLPSLKHKRSFLGGAPAVLQSASSERLQGSGNETPRRKDELWSVFRNIDGEYHKFQTRPSTTKVAVVRSTLLPFLRSFADHPSTSNLRPEDLDRRTVILNKWWTGLLEMLNGRHGESVSGNDRPTILEAVTAIMIRPEWTLPPSLAPSRQARLSRASLKSRSTTSLGSTISDFLVESVFHNVKNTFVQNLYAQMNFVVDRMSTRNVPASVVSFCGKATAYAFFYCDGVAEILVRLWTLPPEAIRRILVENGISRGEIIMGASDRVSVAFPPCLHSLAFKSLRPMMKYLRSKPHLPIATAYIPWHGPWVGRWAGRDTDLFFVFAKYYTELACRFLPEVTSSEENIAAPGWVLVQAQLLTTLDATLQRTNSPLHLVQPDCPSSITFDDLLGEADATATILPLPTNGVVRSMAENRIIMLMRDCLTGSAVITEKTRSVFAESFNNVLKAATRRTSLFDHNACFTLCDFLEEAMAILSRYQQASKSPNIIDWPFWLDVFKHMLQSHNSMTEVRLCAFLYAMWNIITNDEERKSELCLGWLLTPETFQAHFNHWCPMVRAFYMRLLVWKLSRLDGGGSDIDLAILEALCTRLRDTWCNYLYMMERADAQNIAKPSTAPCSPAPRRCLLIIRDDVQPAPSGMFLSFEGILSSSGGTTANPYEKHSSRDPLTHGINSTLEPRSNTRNPTPNINKKRWNLLRSFIPFGSLTAEPPSNAPKDIKSLQHSSTLQISDRGSSNSDTSEAQPQVDEKAMDAGRHPSKSYRSLSFKFSLEWMDTESGPAGRERRLSPPKLPLAARLSLHPRSDEARDLQPQKPEGAAVGPSKYAGRALAEWSILIAECQNFFDRRKAEGVPIYQLVETPTLGVEPFRKL